MKRLLSPFLVLLCLAMVRAGDLEAQSTPLDSVRVELSGAAAITGGVLLADDELVGALLFVPAQTFAQKAPSAFIVKFERGRKAVAQGLSKLLPFQDFEGLASDGATKVYALGSHCGRPRGRVWERRSDREFLIQATWDRGEMRVPTPPKKGPSEKKPLGVYRAFVDDVTREHGTALGVGLNAEGLTLRGADLYVGLRSPVPKKKAQLFRAASKSVFSGKPVTWSRFDLDLGGGGIRGLYWDEATKSLIVISGARTDQPNAPNAIWSCGPEGGSLKRIHSFQGAAGFPEGVCRVSPTELLVVLDAEGARQAPMFRLRYPKQG